MTKLPMNILKGTNIEVDVLNNRRHQLIGVFMPCFFMVTCGFQFVMFQFTKSPSIVKQTPAPGWEVPQNYDWEHIPPTAANIALWRKRQELGHETWNYTMGESYNIALGAHTWNAHKHDHSADHTDDDE